jgi:hypothetical protein
LFLNPHLEERTVDVLEKPSEQGGVRLGEHEAGSLGELKLKSLTMMEHPPMSNVRELRMANQLSKGLKGKFLIRGSRSLILRLKPRKQGKISRIRFGCAR